MHHIKTPYYLIDKAKLKNNMQKIQRFKELSGANILLALKCFATWSVFDLMSQYQDGTTSSSLYEVKLGKQMFGGETHAYSVAFSDDEIKEVLAYADKIIFNSISQLNRFKSIASSIPIGLRVNPGISHSDFIIADPARPNSRLGVADKDLLASVSSEISGLMFHFNCENDNFSLFDDMLLNIEQNFGQIIHQMKWISLGGGIDFMAKDYPIEQLAKRLLDFASHYAVEIFLEPGEASITDCASLETTVLDIVSNGMDIAIVDASIEAHMLDLLIYRESAKVLPNQGNYPYQICGKSCLAGDIFGEFRFEKPLQIGDRISIQDAAGYTMVKKNWFNGVNMPSIVVKELDGNLHVVKTFGYEDYKNSLS
ncbi:carboxynorspermidine decarboxylase [Neisseriaceae bacterium PsAf]|nr:carboxynorspermidine decarboxylase [Neisseriaceae bacterium PsAf]MCV2503687.1 carboxynorspermidine decarboxylase [Neisseriaceae bacterium]